MASREASSVREPDLSDTEETPNDIRRPAQSQQNELIADSSSSHSLNQHSSGALRYPAESRPNAGFSAGVTSDSFGQPLGNNTMFASTQPFSNHQNSTDAEKFLSGPPPVSNQTFTPGSFNRVGGNTPHGSASSSSVSIPKAGCTSVDVSSNTSPRTTNTASPIVAQPRRQVSPSPFRAGPLTPTAHHDPHSNISFYSPAASSTGMRPAAAATADASAPLHSGVRIITATQSSPLMDTSKLPMPTVINSTAYSNKSEPFSPSRLPIATEKSRSALVATASSSGSAANTGFAGPRSLSRWTPSEFYHSATSVNVSTAGPTTLVAGASPRPASHSVNFARTSSNYSSTSHGSDSASLEQLSEGGAVALASYGPLLHNSLTPSRSPQPALGRHGYAPVAAASPASSPTRREARLTHSRSVGELHHLFGDRGYNNNVPVYPAAAFPLQHSIDSPSGVERRSLSRQGTQVLSASSRQRGVVRATESSPGLAGTRTPSASSGGGGGGVQPRWLSAVERVKSNRVNEDLSLYDPVLPYDQSKLSMQTRQAGQQGVLTAGKLRALEVRHAGPIRGSDRGGGLQPLVAYSMAGARSSSPTSRDRVMSPTRMPVLTAQEETIQATTRYNVAMPEQMHRAGYVRAGGGAGSVTAYGGGRHAVTAIPSSLRSTTGGVITASETVINGNHLSSSNGTFVSRSEQGGIPGFAHGGVNQKINTAEHKLASLFQLRLPSNGSGLHANETSACEVVTASIGSANGTGSNSGVLRASEEQKAVAPRNDGSRSSGGAGGAGGGGGGGGRGDSINRNNNDMNSSNRRKVHSKRGDLGKAVPTESPEVKQQINTEGDEDERDERNFRTRNINALHAIPWEQRRQLPMTGFGTRFFALLSTPRFWEKLDWAVRGSLLTVFPTMVLALEPTTTNQFPMASSLAFNAFWITMPTFGSGLRELIIALKGFSFGLLFLIIVVATQPGPDWLLLLLLFIFTLFASFIAEETKKTTAYVLASTIMQYLTDHKGTNFNYVGQYYEGLLIALAFGTAAFLVPFIRWSSDIAQHYIKAMANSLSIDLQGTLSSFWVRSPLERELNVMRLRQLRATAEKCIGKIETALDESGYEPHTGAYMACMVNRFNFCKSIHNILGSMSHVMELIAENPSSIDTPMCNTFGEQIGDDLAIISSAMDRMVLKICDFERIVTPQEIQFFREARERFQEAVSRVREDVILTNENYETDESDILLGFFMFSVDEMCEVISQFEETAHPPSTLVNALLFPIRDIKSVIFAFKHLALTIVRRRTIPRRMKEAIKLSVCMVLPCIFQVYALSNDSVSPMAGASVIALIYNPTGAESFHYASGRLLGTVLGSMASLLSVQIANGRRWVLYLFIILLSFIGAYVQAAPGFYALGNAIVCSTISVCTQYTNQNAAMVRIQQNCFAILMYFAVVTVLWPMRARDKVKMSLDFALRCSRESITRMLRNLDMPEDPGEVTADVSALLIEMNKKVRTQMRFIPGAVEEPTMGSVEYPEDAWKRIVGAERKLWLALSMMRFAYHTFMSSRADATTELSVHWVVLHRISPHTRDLSDLIYAAIDLYLLSLNNTTIVPTSHLTRLRVGMVEAHKAIEETYIKTISRKVAGEDSDEEEGKEEGDGDSFHSSYVVEDYYDPSGYASYLPPPTTNARGFTEVQHGDNSDNKNNNSARDDGGKSNRAASISGAQKGTGGDTDKVDRSVNKDASTTEHRNDDVRHKKGTHRREDSDSSSRSSSRASTASDVDDHHNGNDDNIQHKKKDKKMGYLGYDLTKDEAAVLRAFVATRVVNNNTFRMNKSMVGNKSMIGNMTFNGRLTGAGTMSAAAAAATAALNGGSRGAKLSMAGALPQVNNDARLMAMRGGDDDLAAMLRKKHNVIVKKEQDDYHADRNADDDDNDNTSGKMQGGRPKCGDAETQVENLANLNLTNASFFKNHSFLKNRSFLGSFFNRKAKETHDIDAEEMHGDEVLSSMSANMKSGKKVGRGDQKAFRTSFAVPRREKREKVSDTTSEHSTPNTSLTRSRGEMCSSRQSAATSEFSDIEDEPKLNHRPRREPKRGGGGDMSKVVGKGDGRPPMARSMPLVLSPKVGKYTDGAVANPLEDRGDNADVNPVRMASSTPVISLARATPGKMLSGDAQENASKTVPPLRDLAAEFSETVATVGAHSAEDGNIIFGGTPLDSKSDGGGAASAAALQGPPPTKATEPTAGGEADGDSSGDIPENEHKAHKNAGSGDGSNHTGSTEKKVVSGDVDSGVARGSSMENANCSDDTSDGLKKTPTSPQKAGKNATKSNDRPKGVKSPRRAQDADEVSLHHGPVLHKCDGTNSVGILSPRSRGRAGDGQSNHSADRTVQLLESMQDGEPDDTNYLGEGEILNNISFYDPEKGGFVLTNHDIHSLEAFLFGTQALVNYINELQKAILDMQHETELAKRL